MPKAKKVAPATKIKDTPMTDEEIKELDKIEDEIKNEVSSRNTKGSQQIAIDDLCDKVLLYCEKQAGIDLHPYQKDFGLSIARSLILNEGEEITALFSRQSGKTETVAVILGGCMVILPTLANQMPGLYEIDMFKNGLWVGLFAPSNEQSFTAFSRMRERIRSKNAKMIMNDPEIDTFLENDGKGNPMMLTNGSLCRMQTAAKQAQIESKSYHVVLIDEAQDCDNTKVKKSIHPMLAAYNGTIIKIGTSNTKRSDFYDAIRRNIRNEQKHGARRNHFQFDYKTVQKYNPKYKQFLDKEIKRLGYDSDEFRMAYRLHFILERGMFLTQEELEEKVFDYKLKHKETEREMPCVVGIDVAKGGDSTVVTVLRVDYENMVTNEDTGEEYPMKELVNWLEFNGEDHEVQFNQIVDWLSQFRLSSIFIDSTGVGDPVADRFIHYYSGHAHVEGYKFTRPSKSVMWRALYQEITAGRLRVPAHSRTQRLRAWRKFRSQMLDLEKDYVGQYMVCQHPDEKGAHDDFCDSIALSILASMSEAMPEIQAEDNFLYPTRNDADSRLFGRWRR
jgi:hypothetical protein